MLLAIRRILAINSLLLLGNCLQAQTAIDTLKKHLNILAAPAMHGRGYTNNGVNLAADYIQQEFSNYGLKSFTEEQYLQHYSFPINIFPGAFSLSINGKELVPGEDYIVNAASSGTRFSHKKLNYINLINCKDSLSWVQIKAKFKRNKVYVLQHIDTLMKYNKLSMRTFAKTLEHGNFIIPSSKLIFFATGDITPATIFYVLEKAMPEDPATASARIEQRLIPKFDTKNIIGYVPGTSQADSFVVFTAHYDHLGEMGKNAIFNGASDNASGTSMLLYLAQYYATNPPPYSVAFMAVSGEEVWLLGSTYYVNNPLFSLSSIKMVINMDMMGDATEGLSVINGAAQPELVRNFEANNKANKLLGEIRIAGQSNNSDHFPFSSKNVPAVFLFTRGVNNHYHNVYDVAKDIHFVNGDKVLQLIKHYVNTIQ